MRVRNVGMDEAGVQKWTLTSNQLKMIAVVAIVFDHCMIAFAPHDLLAYDFLRLPGRLTAPIMCFLVAEGYYHTSNLRRYMGRLLLMAVISHLPFTLFLGYEVWAFWQATDVMWSLLFGLVALAVYHQKAWPSWKRVGGILLCCLLAYPADWNYVGVLMILFFGIFHQIKNWQTAAHLGIGGLYLAQGLTYGTSLISRVGIFLSIPLLRRYNGRRGRRSKAIQWAFYWFYPVHLFLLYLLQEWI